MALSDGDAAAWSPSCVAGELPIRPAALDDAEPLADLSTQLGYPVSIEELALRLRELLTADDQVVYVATDGARVVGWIHAARQLLLESGARCEILGLVVDRSARRRGVGGALVAAAERWARERGLGLVSVRSAVTRAESHPFYERLGYERAKTQHVYRKRLGDGPSPHDS